MKKIGNWLLLAGAVSGAVADAGGFLPGAVHQYAILIATLAALFAKVPWPGSADPAVQK